MEFVVIFVLSAAVALLNSLHVIIRWFNNAPGDMFTGIAHSFTDYFLYTAQMAQGVGGRWIFSDHLFTNEPVAPTWYYWFNVALGHVGGIAGLTPFVTYNASLLFLVLILCLMWYCLFQTLYPTNRLLRLSSFFMILTMTNWYWNGELFGQFWFSPAPVFNRLGGVPYQVFQTILFILLMILFSCITKSDKQKAIRKTSNRTLLLLASLLSLIALLAATANPVQTVLFVAAMSITTVYIFTRRKHFNRSKHTHSVALAAVAVAGAFGAWMTTQEFTRQAVFVAARAWEQSQYVPNNLPVLLKSIGPILLFVPFGVPMALKQTRPLRTLITLWGLLSFALFLTPIPRFLGISPVRFLHPVPYASLAILGADGLVLLSGSSRTKRVLLIILYALLTIPAISQQFVDRITPMRNPQLLMDTIYNHVPAPIEDGLAWLKKQDQTGVVLTDPALPIEVLVPVLSGKISFSGHPIHTLYPDVKEALRQEFFNGNMTPDQADRFLSDHRIGYIIAAPTRVLPPLTPTLVTEVYKNSSVTIYTL